MKDDRLISCLESTRESDFEQRTLTVCSWFMTKEEFLWRMTSIEEEVFPTKWWYVGWPISEDEEYSSRV